MKIYLIKNFTLKECYFGITPADVRDAISEHRASPDSPISHWKWGEEEIKWGLVEDGLHEAYARAFLQALRREPQEDDWVLVVGGGDYAEYT